MPKKWYNINADLPCELPMPKNSEGRNQIEDLQKAFTKAALDQEFATERYIKIPQKVRELYMQMGRPTPLFRAKRLEEKLNTPAKIYYKREDTSPTGSHKLNSAIPQAYFAKKEGVERLTTETGAGQWGTALSLACSLLDLDCTVYMVKVSFNQKPDRKNIMNIYGGEVFASPSENTEFGRKVLAENPDHVGSLGIAISEAMEEALNNDNVKYTLGSVLNHVMLHQTVIGQELKTQLEIANEEPDTMIACVGGGSNAMGAFYNFIDDADVKLIGCEAGGKGVDTPYHAAALTNGQIGIFHGMKSIFNQGEYGQISEVYSVSAGLDYPGVGPEHAYLRDIKRAEYVPVTDEEAVNAFEYLSKMEGIIPAIESAHAVAHAMKIAPKMDKDEIIMVCLSGRGDKDVASIAKYRGVELNE